MRPPGKAPARTWAQPTAPVASAYFALCMTGEDTTSTFEADGEEPARVPKCIFKLKGEEDGLGTVGV